MEGSHRCSENKIPGYTETFHCSGHRNITGTHRSTFEITKDPEVSGSGNCIIGVSSEKSAGDLSDEFKKIMADDRAALTSLFEVEDQYFQVRSSGSGSMIFDHDTDMVWRRSGFTCGRTVGIFSDCTAALIPRSIIDRIRKGAEIKVTLTARLNPESQLPSSLPLPGIFHNFEEAPSPCYRESGSP